MKKNTHLTDKLLVEKYAAGDNRAFETLLFRCKDKVFGYIHFLTRDQELSNDIFQETFIKAIDFIQQGRYTESGNFVAWLNRIAYNLVIDYFRKESRTNVFSGDENDFFSSLNLLENNIEDTLVREQQLLEVVKLIDLLPKNQQDVVRMRIFEGLSFQEISEVTNVSLNTALGRMRYALIGMRKLAAQYDY